MRQTFRLPVYLFFYFRILMTVLPGRLQRIFILRSRHINIITTRKINQYGLCFIVSYQVIPLRHNR